MIATQYESGGIGMSTILTILQCKVNCPLAFIRPDATVLEATQLMNAQKIGSVLVMTGDRLLGIFTERDVLQRVVAEMRPAATTLVWDVMTADVICCGPNEDIDDVGDLMRSHRIRHVPIKDALGIVIGLISIGDINAYRVKSFETSLQQVEDYMHRRS